MHLKTKMSGSMTSERNASTESAPVALTSRIKYLQCELPQVLQSSLILD